MKKTIVFAVLALLVIAVVLVIMKITSMKKQINDLTAERQNLAFSLGQRVTELDSLNDKLKKLEAEYKREHKKLEEVTSRNSAIKAENIALREEIDNVTMERDALQAKFISIPELKKMIKELKEKQRQVDRIMNKRPGAENPETIEKVIPAEIEEAHEPVRGNQGYIIRDGQPTNNTSVVIDVEPAPSQ